MDSWSSWTLGASANSKWLAEYWRVARDMVVVVVEEEEIGV
jgi:hypothetical protein